MSATVMGGMVPLEVAAHGMGGRLRRNSLQNELSREFRHVPDEDFRILSGMSGLWERPQARLVGAQLSAWALRDDCEKGVRPTAGSDGTSWVGAGARDHGPIRLGALLSWLHGAHSAGRKTPAHARDSCGVRRCLAEAYAWPHSPSERVGRSLRLETCEVGKLSSCFGGVKRSSALHKHGSLSCPFFPGSQDDRTVIENSLRRVLMFSRLDPDRLQRVRGAFSAVCSADLTQGSRAVRSACLGTSPKKGVPRPNGIGPHPTLPTPTPA